MSQAAAQGKKVGHLCSSGPRMDKNEHPDIFQLEYVAIHIPSYYWAAKPLGSGTFHAALLPLHWFKWRFGRALRAKGLVDCRFTCLKRIQGCMVQRCTTKISGFCGNLWPQRIWVL